MKNKVLADKIKELRKRKGLSQEELSENTGLSLRTIQRIENGETEPRSYSLTILAKTFDVSPDEITDWQIVEERQVVNMLSYSQLAFLAFPILGIIVPLVIWLLKKDKVKDILKIGKAIINFQITWSIVLFLVYITLALSIIIKIPVIYNTLTIYLTIAALYLFNLFMILINSFRSSRRKKVFYIPAIKILR